MKVHCESTLISAEGRKLEFLVKASDEKGLIGEGTHQRTMVNAERFMEKLREQNQ
jgi:predicted thioesterase